MHGRRVGVSEGRDNTVGAPRSRHLEKRASIACDDGSDAAMAKHGPGNCKWARGEEGPCNQRTAKGGAYTHAL